MFKHITTMLFALIALMMKSPPLLAQDDSDAVNKVIVKSIPISSNDAFAVVGEKATIQVTGWAKKYIQAKITFAAFHPEKEIATRELELMQYALTREKNTIELRNGFILPSATDHIQSKLEILIELSIPGGTALTVTNRYGNTDISRFRGKITAMMEFSDLNINHVQGEFTLKSLYSEIRSQQMEVSSFTCSDEKSQVYMDVTTGEYTFNSKHSDINLTLKNVKALTVKASRTNVTVMPSDYSQYDYNLNSDGKIFIPAQYTAQLKKSGKQNIFQMKSTPAKPIIEITTTFNTITIK